MTNLYLDASSLSYAWNADGREILSAFFAYARSRGLDPVITDVVKAELAQGTAPRTDLTAWLAEQGVQTKTTNEIVSYRLALSGNPPPGYSIDDAGERSMVEAINADPATKASARILADDKRFFNRVNSSPASPWKDITTNNIVQNADLFNQAAQAGYIPRSRYAALLENLRTANPVYNPARSGPREGYSPDLDRFLKAEQLDEVLAGAPLSSVTLMRLAKPLAVIGVAGTILDITTSSAEAAGAANAGNNAGAAQILSRLAARLFYGWQGTVAGASIGGALGAPGGLLAGVTALIGGAAGGIAGSLGGELMVAAIWAAADNAVKILNGEVFEPVGGRQELFTTTGSVYRGLIAGGTPAAQAQHVIDSLNNDWIAAQKVTPTLRAEDFYAQTLGNVSANQAIASTGELGPVIRTIGNGTTGSIDIYDDLGQVAVKLNGANDPSIAATAFDSLGTRVSSSASSSDGGMLETSYDVASGSVARTATFNANGIRTAAVTYDFANTQLYSRYEINYNAAGQQIAYKTYSDNGTRTEITYDPANLQNWSNVVERYNAAGQRLDSTTNSDNGSQSITFFDTQTGAAKQLDNYAADGKRTQSVIYDYASVNTWTRYEINYNAGGQATSRSDLFDTGARNETTYDPGNAQNWTNVVKRYNATGQLFDSTTNFDAGSRSVTTFDLPTGGAKLTETFGLDGKRTQAITYDYTSINTWSRFEVNYNGANQAISRTDFFDSGAKNETTYDPGNTENWLNVVKRFNTAGQLVDNTTSFDSGSRSVTTFDLPTGAAKQTETFAADGKRTNKITYDTANAGSWARMEIAYNAAGQITAQTDFYDDSTRITTNYDPANLQTWTNTQQKYNAAGQQLSDTITADDGTRTVTRFDLQSGVVRERELIGASGYRTQLITYDVSGTNSWSRLETGYDASGRETVLSTYDDNSKLVSRTYSDAANGQTWSKIEINFDANGNRVQQSDYLDDGLRRVTNYDPTDTQIWDKEQKEYNAAGSLLLEHQFYDDGTRLSVVYNPPGTEPRTRAELSFDAGQRLVFQNDVYANGKRVVTKYDPAGEQSWSRLTQVFDANGQLVNDVIVDDSGAFTQTDNDTSGTFYWRSAHHVFNASGQKTSEDVTRDDGTRFVTSFDPSNGQIWSQSTQQFNASGQLTAEVVIADNGERVVTELDPTNLASWTRNVFGYNGAGQNVSQEFALDDGRRTFTVFDVGNTQSWAKNTHQYNSAGQLTNEVTTNDDGSRSQADWDPGSAFEWISNVFKYDAAGRNTSQDITFDNGRRSLTVFDTNNVQPWSGKVQVFNAAGQLINDVVFDDSGIRTQTDLDPANEFDWRSGNHRYNAAGQKTSQDVITDDGRRIYEAYDLNNAQPWQRLTQTFNAAGQKTNEKQVYDDGSSAYFTFIPSSGAIASVTTFDTNGNVVSPPRPSYSGYSNSSNWSDTPYSGYQEPIRTSVPRPVAPTPSPRPIAAPTPRPRIVAPVPRPASERPPGSLTPVRESVVTVRNLPPLPTPAPRLPNINVPTVPGTGWYWTTPVLLDLNGDHHLDLRPLDAGLTAPSFDWNGDGLRDETAWVGQADGFLAIDLAADGSSGSDGLINQAEELAFSTWADPALEPDGVVSDLDGLRLVFDTNHDSRLDSSDDRWNEFRVWQDANQNGTTDANELRTMSEAGIKLINLVPSANGSRSFMDGSAITGTSTAHRSDGSTLLVGDASLAYRQRMN